MNSIKSNELVDFTQKFGLWSLSEYENDTFYESSDLLHKSKGHPSTCSRMLCLWSMISSVFKKN
jgi:hypothetical protein